MSELPIEYTPLSHSYLESGMEFGPLEFAVHPHSHEKSKKFLEESDVNEETEISTPYLFPSEMWGWAHVLSRYFGRLNEVAVSRATWEVHGKAFPEQKLISRSRITSVQSRNGLPFAAAETCTEDTKGMTLIRCVDEILLLHDVHEKFYQERAKETPLPPEPSYQRTRRVYFRHEWDNGKWANNIHTDDYARQFGYERGLPEFIMYMDWIFLTQLEQFGEEAYENKIINMRKILPVYKGEVIHVFGQREAQHDNVQFFRGHQERLKAVVRTQ